MVIETFLEEVLSNLRISRTPLEISRSTRCSWCHGSIYGYNHPILPTQCVLHFVIALKPNSSKTPSGKRWYDHLGLTYLKFYPIKHYVWIFVILPCSWFYKVFIICNSLQQLHYSFRDKSVSFQQILRIVKQFAIIFIIIVLVWGILRKSLKNYFYLEITMQKSKLFGKKFEAHGQRYKCLLHL